ncbi:hypothetical protein E2C01_022304 [Portunus trituberculatus]|uniref:Uncharacterized protein n=1 Tax=Portunus trituberculatus TaxID=210409 RepID=A0A5B7E7A4_PORTR|nr:hypothetical protein [Portunus trituberculatus]
MKIIYPTTAFNNQPLHLGSVTTNRLLDRNYRAAPLIDLLPPDIHLRPSLHATRLPHRIILLKSDAPSWS